tara:strand:- start:2750 stop:3352 length:603 start_codon:yes stop_codon:yes gene_type:complete
MNTSITEDSTVANEGGTLSFTITSPSSSLNKSLYWSTEQEGLEGNLTASDFTDVSLTGSLWIWTSPQTFTRTLTRDRDTEGTERFRITIREGGVAGIALTSSNIITINDTSTIVGQDSDGLTYGPIIVNADSGNTSNTSDWYTICGLDRLPDGSKVAIYKNDYAAEASYNQLVSKLNERNITVMTVTGNDWVDAFTKDLS